jgi:hypothetical protein
VSKELKDGAAVQPAIFLNTECSSYLTGNSTSDVAGATLAKSSTHPPRVLKEK